MARIRCISFDFDDTLLRSELCKAETLKEVASAYEGGLEILEATPRDSRTAPPGQVVTRDTIFRAVAEGLHARGVKPGPAGETPEQFGVRMCSQFSELVQVRLTQAAEVRGAAAMLAHLTACGLPCYVNSATPKVPLEQLVNARGWGRFFVAVHGAPATKAQNLAAIMAQQQLGPGEILHVGDGENDCSAASEVGCAFMGVSSPDGVARAFKAPVHVLVQDMHHACLEICKLADLPPP
mmetsp:Transcript_16572/g.35564  ORF Transcript_16572/g.35564 Transcript_16572/m.35564 type:complete len:238 (+) Transcript_16572:318-1031(+)|eukprot:3644258-Pleurochrysis_carterae.AAC.1